MQYFDSDDPYDGDSTHLSPENSDTVRAYSSHGGHSRTTPVRPPSVQPRHRYAPYYTPPYMFPDVPSPSSASIEKLLSSVVETQKKEMALVENVSSRLSELERVVSISVLNSAERSSTSPEEKKRLPPQLSVCSNHKLLYAVINKCVLENCGHNS
jgi:hypothetical protein